MSMTRILSGILAASYLVSAYMFSGAQLAWKVWIALVFVLGCIWFPDELGAYVGPAGKDFITAPTPGPLIRLFGWLMLATPAVIGLIRVLFE